MKLPHCKPPPTQNMPSDSVTFPVFTTWISTSPGCPRSFPTSTTPPFILTRLPAERWAQLQPPQTLPLP